LNKLFSKSKEIQMKKILAIAIATAFAAPAFAATSNVDVYGVLNVSIDRVDPDQAGKDSTTNVTSNASRLGFKGSEDLGGGLKAIWQVESGFNADTGGGSIGSRNTFVGLSGDWGTVLAGRHDTPMKMLGRKVDNFGDGMADDRNIIGSSAVDGKNMFDGRPNNVIAYITPNFSGLTAVVAYVTDNNSGAAASCVSTLDCNKTDAYSVMADYANGPFMAGLGYEKHNVANGDSRSLWRAVGGFKFGDAKLGALYESGSADASLAPADRNAWGLFGNYAIGAITLKANYLKADDYANVANSGADQYTLGVDYALSKRSTAYAYYAKVNNDTNAAFGLGIGGGASSKVNAVNTDPSVFGIGMKHTF
jgi:predicted porin